MPLPDQGFTTASPKVWSTRMPRRLPSPAVLNGATRVVLGRGDGKVVAYDLATGDQLWTYDAEEAVLGTPASFGRSS